ncbi:MAG: hypothetical protein KAJ48_06340, partial [Elusimicrobiales bacterium]|nr:hypothetical protein [Elusimicrobiales bacterium]
NVGIGTSAPNYKLDVSGDINTVGTGDSYRLNTHRVLSRDGQTYYIGGIDADAIPVKIRANGKDVIHIAKDGDVGIGRSPSYPLDIKGDVRITSLNFSSPGILRGLCTARRYRENRPSRCRFGEKIIGYYGDGNVQVYGFLAADGSMSGTGTYITMGQDWNGTMICCKIEID